jgi:putative DNA primase/helicase
VRQATDADACRQLLTHLPFQAALAVGGERVIGPVAVEMKSRKTGIGPKAVKEAVADYERRARVQTNGQTPEWATSLTQTAAGTVKKGIANATTILANDPDWAGVLAYDLFSEASVLRKEPPWDAAEKPAKPFVAGQPLEEEDAARVVAWLERKYEMSISTTMAHEVLEVVAHANAFHPVRDYLHSLVWDGVHRVAGKDSSGLFTTHAKVEDSEYVRCVGRWFMVGAVARVMQPGCKVDTMTILEGPQGIGKSTFLRVLFSDRWFSDTLSEIGSKDSYQDLRGKWGIEMGELDALSRAENSTQKRFLAKSYDNYRASYGRRNRDVPRQVVFPGTVNHSEYLKDSTGGRRFHPVKCTGVIDIEGVRRDRDQLWAEALHLYRAGERWWPEGDEVGLCTEEQEDRRQRDPWEAAITEALAKVNETTTQYILGNVFVIPLDQQHRGHETRVGQVMMALGWTKHRRRLEDGSREWFYVRPGCQPSAKPAPRKLREELCTEDEIASDALAQIMAEHCEPSIVEITCVMNGTSTMDAPAATTTSSTQFMSSESADDTCDDDDDHDDYARGIAYRSVYGHSRDDEGDDGRELQ